MGVVEVLVEGVDDDLLDLLPGDVREGRAEALEPDEQLVDGDVPVAGLVELVEGVLEAVARVLVEDQELRDARALVAEPPRGDRLVVVEEGPLRRRRRARRGRARRGRGRLGRGRLGDAEHGVAEAPLAPLDEVDELAEGHVAVVVGVEAVREELLDVVDVEVGEDAARQRGQAPVELARGELAVLGRVERRERLAERLAAVLEDDEQLADLDRRGGPELGVPQRRRRGGGRRRGRRGRRRERRRDLLLEGQPRPREGPAPPLREAQELGERHVGVAVLVHGLADERGRVLGRKRREVVAGQVREARVELAEGDLAVARAVPGREERRQVRAGVLEVAEELRDRPPEVFAARPRGGLRRDGRGRRRPRRLRPVGERQGHVPQARRRPPVDVARVARRVQDQELRRGPRWEARAPVRRGRAQVLPGVLERGLAVDRDGVAPQVEALQRARAGLAARRG